MTLHITLPASGKQDEIEMALEDRIVQLRENGMTFKAIGQALGLTSSRSRNIYLRACSRHTGRKPLWTDGLNQRLANSLRWLEFSNRDEVAEAFKSGHIQRLAACERGLISAAALAELERWLARSERQRSERTA